MGGSFREANEVHLSYQLYGAEASKSLIIRYGSMSPTHGLHIFRAANIFDLLNMAHRGNLGGQGPLHNSQTPSRFPSRTADHVYHRVQIMYVSRLLSCRRLGSSTAIAQCPPALLVEAYQAMAVLVWSCVRRLNLGKATNRKRSRPTSLKVQPRCHIYSDCIRRYGFRMREAGAIEVHLFGGSL